MVSSWPIFLLVYQLSIIKETDIPCLHALGEEREGLGPGGVALDISLGEEVRPGLSYPDSVSDKYR